MHQAGCSHLVYGLESFDPLIMKNLGKGSNPQKNADSVDICLQSGIKPIPNIIIGFPEESFDSVRNTIVALKKLGITCKPHFATPYPGSEWYYTYKDSIIEQYDGNLEAFIEDLATPAKFPPSSATSSPPWSCWACSKSCTRRICACWTRRKSIGPRRTK